MKRAASHFLFCTVALLLPLTAPAAALVVTEHWPPWLVAHDPDREKVTDGAAIHLLRELFARTQVEFEFSNVPWQRALVKLEEGEADMMPLIARTAERDRYMVFTDPLYTDELLFVASVMNGVSCEWTHSGALAGKTVGTVRDYQYGEMWTKLSRERNFVVIPANDDLTNLKKVATGRLDYTVQYLSFLRSSLTGEQINREQLTVCQRPVEKIPLRLGISRKSPLAGRVDEFNRTLRAMRADGSYRKILGDLYSEPVELDAP